MKERRENKELKAWMKRLRWTPKQLATALGVSDGSIHAYMSWGVTPRGRTLDRFTEVIKIHHPHEKMTASELFRR